MPEAGRARWMRWLVVSLAIVIADLATKAWVSGAFAPGEVLEVTVKPSAHAKCERCWHYRGDVGANAKHASICARCVSNLEGPGEAREHA